MAKPKLCLIPAAQGDKFYSVLPSSGVGDFDFSRSGGATRINSQGLIETVADGVSRLNYPLIDGKVVGCPSHLLENSATNLVLESNNFDNYFSKLNSASVQSNQIISPDGTVNADKVIRGTADLALRRNSQVTIGTENTFSIYVKKGTASSVRLDIGDEGVKTFYLTDYWQRISVTATPSSYGHIDIEIPNANQGDYIYVFGAMAEQGSYPTSYIPTNGSTATRSAETATNSGDAPTFNSSEGVLMVETKGENDGTFNYISLSDGSTTNYAGILYTDEDNQITYRYYVGGNGVQIVIENIIVTNFNKIAIKYKANDFAIWINGIEVGTASSGSLNPIGTFNQLAFARGGANNTPFYGNTKQIQYYDTALNDSDLEKLTSWVSFSDMANGQLYTIE